jgi:HD superfamily phosphodiesterase
MVMVRTEEIKKREEIERDAMRYAKRGGILEEREKRFGGVNVRKHSVPDLHRKPDILSSEHFR